MMRNPGTSFFVILALLLGYLFFGSWYWPCQVKGLCGNQPQAVSPQSPTPPPAAPSLMTPFAVKYGAENRFQAKEGILFARHQANPTFGMPVRLEMGKLMEMLREDNLKDLLITGLYGLNDSLPAGVDASNLGLARANAMKAQLVEGGVPADQILSFYERLEIDDLYDATDTLRGGLRFEVVDREQDEALENPLAEASKVYFETGSSYVPLDSSLRQTITQTLQYLLHKPESRLSLVGHTDNVGKAESNLILGKDRAAQLARYFRDFGLELDRIDVSSQGQTQPIASNETDEGRALNRRVEMRIP
jgi:OOP family OmpA-OmpF porin